MKLYNSLCPQDELVALQDSEIFRDNSLGYLSQITSKKENVTENTIIIKNHPLNNDYGAHKNYGIEQCSGDFIFQLDGDELPPDSLLGENLHSLIESNPTIEAYAVPRINDFKGVTIEHAKQWGWRLDNSPIYNRPRVNFPDYQFRIFKKDYPRISFLRKLHEKIEGYNEYSFLPAEEDYALYHDKTIEKQIETNIRYNKNFSESDNKGHTIK
jgi:glycosyltransferase involved in cell wall biosynthesis